MKITTGKLRQGGHHAIQEKQESRCQEVHEKCAVYFGSFQTKHATWNGPTEARVSFKYNMSGGRARDLHEGKEGMLARLGIK